MFSYKISELLIQEVEIVATMTHRGFTPDPSCFDPPEPKEFIWDAFIEVVTNGEKPQRVCITSLLSDTTKDEIDDHLALYYEEEEE